MTAPHIPVMCPEVLTALAPRAGEIIVDGTFGAGGYTRAILDAAPCSVYAIDRDPRARATAETVKATYGDRFHFLAGCFGDMEDLLAAAHVTAVDGVVLDIGVSSMQIDEADRGFSFQKDGPLDMRMGDDTGETAADLVNRLDAEELAHIIFNYGEERHSRRIARAIVTMRAEKPITRTSELASIVERAVPGGIHARKKGGIHAATRTFQALRIAVNDELGELRRGLTAAERILKSGGRLVVVTFHSLEDRIVKNFLRRRSAMLSGGSRHLPEVKMTQAPSFTLITRKAIEAGAEEVARNPRARSAKLRAALRTDAMAWPLDKGEAA